MPGFVGRIKIPGAWKTKFDLADMFRLDEIAAPRLWFDFGLTGLVARWQLFHIC